MTDATGGRNRTKELKPCGASLVDWQPIQRHEFGDVESTFEALQHELIRRHFWHKQLDQAAINHARRTGRSGMRQAATARIRTSVAPSNHPRQGRQTPVGGNALSVRSTLLPLWRAERSGPVVCGPSGRGRLGARRRPRGDRLTYDLVLLS